MGLQILLVDDNVDAIATLSAVLRLEGHTVHVARNGTDGYALAQQALPDVAILDIGMPGMNGFELAVNLRNLADGRRLLMVANTGYGMPEHKVAGKKAGFDFYLTKTREVTEILEILCNYESAVPLAEAPKRKSTAPSVSSRALQKAAEVLGGRAKLCRHLRVAPSDLQKWLDDKEAPPLSVLLRTVDCILDETHPPVEASDPGDPASPRDCSSANGPEATRY
jgi:CheY-like chemotaxis protein